ncbi:hypothetical protein FB451DRAFT_1522730 [Mycena latifolia]|nr:hypothetical protein FB451DRAFT_1522730 [Mycena latifolia]
MAPGFLLTGTTTNASPSASTTSPPSSQARASDGLMPTWLAVYDIDDTATFVHESYTRLRAPRSPHEAALVKRLSLLFSTDEPGGGGVRPTPVVLAQWLDDAPKEAAVGTWRGARGGPEAQKVPRYLVVHGASLVFSFLFAFLMRGDATLTRMIDRALDLAAADAPAFTDSGVAESRLWALYGMYLCDTQGNLEAAT